MLYFIFQCRNVLLIQHNKILKQATNTINTNKIIHITQMKTHVSMGMIEPGWKIIGMLLFLCLVTYVGFYFVTYTARFKSYHKERWMLNKWLTFIFLKIPSRIVFLVKWYLCKKHSNRISVFGCVVICSVPLPVCLSHQSVQC